MNSLLANPENYIGILPLLIFAAIAFFGVVAQKKRIEKLRDVAAELGLQFTEKELITKPTPENRWQHVADLWELTGQYHGVKVRVFARSVSQGRSSTTTTFVVASFKEPIPGNLNISADNSFYKFVSFLIPSEIKVGDESLNKKYYLRGDSADTMLTFLKRPGVENALDDLFAHSKKISVRSDGIWGQSAGHVTDTHLLREALDLVTSKVQIFEQKA